MKALTKHPLTIVCIVLLVSSMAFARTAEPNEPNRPDRPDQAQGIAPGSPHRAPELAGLPHINLTKQQKEHIEEIVANNQEGLRAIQKAVQEAQKAFKEAAEAGRPNAIRKAALELGEAIGEKGIFDNQVVRAIQNVLTDNQLEALEIYNAKSRVWMVQGKLTAQKEEPQQPQKPEQPEE